ncbi:MAG TPA: flagellar biosynthetic protein FliO [Verrucomicrobiae bacterium]
MHSAFAQTNDFGTAHLVAPSLPDASISFIRVLGALALVIGLFLGGVWFFKNWQRFSIQRGRAPKLNVLETRSLGGRHAIYVVGYNHERFLISSSPGGVNFLSHLPSATEGELDATAKNPPAPSFAQALTQVLKGK